MLLVFCSSEFSPCGILGTLCVQIVFFVLVVSLLRYKALHIYDISI
nr:MAG TPA: hypothetical protein [Caudoviricetes sp.]